MRVNAVNGNKPGGGQLNTQTSNRQIKISEINFLRKTSKAELDSFQKSNVNEKISKLGKSNITDNEFITLYNYVKSLLTRKTTQKIA